MWLPLHKWRAIDVSVVTADIGGSFSSLAKRLPPFLDASPVRVAALQGHRVIFASIAWTRGGCRSALTLNLSEHFRTVQRPIERSARLPS